MGQFELAQAIEILEKTPAILKTWLENASEAWVQYKSDDESWSAFDIVGHFIHGEKTDWIPRAQMILHGEGEKEFVRFNRFAHFENSQGKTLADLLEEFSRLREKNLETLRGFDLQPDDIALEGKHPDLGTVNLGQLIATWVVHDLEHLSSIAHEMAQRYKQDVGPWIAYLEVLKG